MKTIAMFFASRRYWDNEEDLLRVYEKLRSDMVGIADECALVTTEEDMEKIGTDALLLVIPMSGAVQRLILVAAVKFPTVVLYAAYIKGNSDVDAVAHMMRKNAAPTLMDCWGALRRIHENARLTLNIEQLKRVQRICLAAEKVRHSKLLLIGDTEPWVISNSEDLKDYEHLGIEIMKICQSEVAAVYHTMTEREGYPYYEHFRNDAQAVIEPSEEDIMNSCRMAAALMAVMDKYQADGIALACFNLLEEGTNSCLGVSYINDCTNKIAACEGDVDSAVTMLLLKQLTGSQIWMANPGLHPEGIINFSHCTAPLCIRRFETCRYTLRSHHESGIGTSLQVEFPVGMPVTACRISDHAEKITIHRGTTIIGEYECACRTQMYVKLDDYEHYLDTALGCHQVFAFEDIAEDMEFLAKQLKLQVL